MLPGRRGDRPQPRAARRRQPDFVGAFLDRGQPRARPRAALARLPGRRPARRSSTASGDYVDEPPRNDIAELAELEATALGRREHGDGQRGDGRWRPSSSCAATSCAATRPPTTSSRQAELDGEERDPGRGCAGRSSRSSSARSVADTVFFGFDLRPGDVRGDRPNGDPRLLPRRSRSRPARRASGSTPRSPTTSRGRRRAGTRLVGSPRRRAEADLDALTHARADNARLTDAGRARGRDVGAQRRPPRARQLAAPVPHVHPRRHCSI